MKILFLDQFSELGGAQLCLLDLLPALRENGWEAHAALPGAGPMVDHLQAKGVAVTPIPCGPYQAGRKRVADVVRFAADLTRQTAELGRLLDRDVFDLLYVNGPRILPAAAVAGRGRLPVLFHAHNRIDTGYGMRLAGWAIRRAQATIVACSRFTAEPLRPYASNGRLHVIPNGTADLGFREQRPNAAGSWRIGMIGRVTEQKGAAEFLRAALALAPGLPNARFIICGAADSARYVDTLREAARRQPIDFLGWRDDIGAVLRGLDLLVVPSRQEGLPRVLLEAFSAGVPVVAFPAGGIVEAIDDEETGFLVPESSAAALAARLKELICGDPRRLRDVAQNARWLWQRSYRLPLYRERIMETMRQVMTAPLPECETIEQPARR